MKYIIFDLDDTILNSNKETSEYTLNVLKQCQDKGCLLVFNTARSYLNSLSCLNQIQPDYAILNGGALIIDKKHNEIYKAVVDKKITNEIVLELLQCTSKLSVESVNGLFSNDSTYVNQFNTYLDMSNGVNLEAYKIISLVSDNEKYEQLLKKYDVVDTCYFGSDWHRITNKYASKYLGIVHLMDYVHGNIKDCITFGDDIGDLEMLCKVNGVAMKNSHEEVLKKIKNVTLTNDENGVAVYLENNILKN